MGWDKRPTDLMDVINKDYEALATKNAKDVLKELLGDDVSLIEKISVDPEEGKFHNVVAPESVLVKLREAGYL